MISAQPAAQSASELNKPLFHIKAIAVAVTLIGSAATAQSTVDLTIDDAATIARRALFAGDAEVALTLANAILAEQPDNRDALMIVATAAPQAGDPEAGWRAGARAWRLSQTDPQKYEAARVTALAAANAEWFTLSTIWLRLALLDAPNDTERERTITDARTVQRRNPWTNSASFSIVPSNNVNSGSSDDNDGGGGTFSEDAQALSGFRTSLSLGTQYRILETPTSRTTIGAKLQSSRVSLDDDGAPNTFDTDGTPTSFIDNANFATDYLELSLNHLYALENGTVNFGIANGRFDFGGERYYGFRRIDLARRLQLTDEIGLQLFARRELQDYESIGIVETRRSTLSTSLSYRRENGDRITGTLTHLRSTSPNANFEFDEWALQGAYTWSDPFGPVTLSLNAGIKEAVYSEYVQLGVVTGREDTTFTYGANLGFPDVEFAGFVPGIAITGSVAESDVTRFQRNTFAVGFTLSSSF